MRRSYSHLKTTVLGIICVALLISCARTPEFSDDTHYPDPELQPYDGSLSVTTNPSFGAMMSDSSLGTMAATGHSAISGGGMSNIGPTNYAQAQETYLRRSLSGTGVTVIRNGEAIQLIIPGNITFTPGSAQLNPDFYPVLSAVADVINQFDETQVNVAGYTDSSGTPEVNQQLSQARAQNVANYLVSQGVSNNRVQSFGYGSENPIASNATPEGRAINRRVEISLIPDE